jgi:predicted HD phosphohydrolase
VSLRRRCRPDFGRPVTAIGPVLRQAADDAADGADAKLVSAARAKREKSQAEEFARLMPLIRRYARLHATAVAAIIISGDPKIDEPLVRAWERTLAHYRLEIKDPTPNNYIKGPFPELRVAEKIYPAIVEDPDYGRPTLGGILVLRMPRNQRDSRKYLERHRFGCCSLLGLDWTLHC